MSFCKVLTESTAGLRAHVVICLQISEKTGVEFQNFLWKKARAIRTNHLKNKVKFRGKSSLPEGNYQQQFTLNFYSKINSKTESLPLNKVCRGGANLFRLNLFYELNWFILLWSWTHSLVIQGFRFPVLTSASLDLLLKKVQDFLANLVAAEGATFPFVYLQNVYVVYIFQIDASNPCQSFSSIFNPFIPKISNSSPQCLSYNSYDFSSEDLVLGNWIIP